jgi:hypothetical protein
MSEIALEEKVDRDPKLTGSEKETTISMYGDDKRFKMYSAKPTVVKSLLKHDHFEMEWARVLDGETSEYYEGRDELREANGKIVAIEGTLPVGTLTVKSKPRANNHQSSIVSWDTIDPSVFENNDS